MTPEPVFEEPWHAQVFALTVHLNEAGHFDWPDWAARFGQTLAQHGLDRDLNGGADYFDAWFERLRRKRFYLCGRARRLEGQPSKPPEVFRA